MWGGTPMPGPLNSAPSCTGRPKGRGQGLDPGEASPHSKASLQTTESKPPHPHFQCPGGETEALRGAEVCLRLHGRACSGGRQSDWNDTGRKTKTQRYRLESPSDGGRKRSRDTKGDRSNYMGLHRLPALGSPVQGSKITSHNQVCKVLTAVSTGRRPVVGGGPKARNVGETRWQGDQKTCCLP